MANMTTAAAVEVCGSCGVTIQTCEECGGTYCSASCVDRSEDGCVCLVEDDDGGPTV